MEKCGTQSRVEWQTARRFVQNHEKSVENSGLYGGNVRLVLFRTTVGREMCGFFMKV